MDLGEIAGRCGAREIRFDESYRTRQERYFDFGPRWRNVQSLRLGEGEALAELRLGEDFLEDQQRWFLHPSLLDMATGIALYLIPGYEESEAVYLPLSYKRMTLLSSVACALLQPHRSNAENTGERGVATFRITLLDPEGEVLAEIGDFAVRRMAVPAGPLNCPPSSLLAARTRCRCQSWKGCPRCRRWRHSHRFSTPVCRAR